MKTKRCPRCGETKEITEFNKTKATKDGLQGYCRPCSRESVRQSTSKKDTVENTERRQRIKNYKNPYINGTGAKPAKSEHSKREARKRCEEFLRQLDSCDDELYIENDGLISEHLQKQRQWRNKKQGFPIHKPPRRRILKSIKDIKYNRKKDIS